MKAIVNTADSQSIYRIEAARISFELLNQAFNELKMTLVAIEEKEKSQYSFQDALNVVKLAFQFVDCTHRFFTVLSQIRGLKHKNEIFKNAESYAKKLAVVRNFAQHLNDEIPKITNETYPILGAISWASDDHAVSRTISLGTLPPGTSFHSLAYDTKEQCYNKSIVFNIGNLEIDLTETHNAMVSVQSFFYDWLLEHKLLSDQDVVPNVMVVESLGGIPNTARYVRAKYLVNK
jgi:hypothetical protein